MSQGSSVPFFIFLAIFLFFLFTNKGKKGKEVLVKPAFKKPVPKKPVFQKNTPIKRSGYTEKRDTSYEVEKKKEIPFLKQTWKKKNSLKQAFILSEILKREHERDSF